MSNSLNPDQGPNCLQMSSADKKKLPPARKVLQFQIYLLEHYHAEG